MTYLSAAASEVPVSYYLIEIEITAEFMLYGFTVEKSADLILKP